MEPEEDKDWEDDPNLPDDEPDKKWNIPQVPEGFTQNPEMVSIEQLHIFKGLTYGLAGSDDFDCGTLIYSESCYKSLATHPRPFLQDQRYEFTCHEHAEQRWAQCLWSDCRTS